mmetsp:Transcript_20130/g.25499  ORF Transcript_20130/g.25499 Transcript_20130/m.25499 type:complete len:134 (-) Transcript_20130:110-511(-)|eukprot:CAMPEP_0206182600 /NCGR_PEP_ID=MMETSP0166-20121206/155_1 /ASSEMBLY_ACC=CAM_ASM_000260 /TAXON_ID=95228 /ORGANISM="Vannella robusta, Strain DIVA3 518/3/11/1/6" /LENGTH=133 /DNA_ID=CAMNT_0053597327 /DNA_START=134 /DNA_END=535 /DNA_ORIENTATION=-
MNVLRQELPDVDESTSTHQWDDWHEVDIIAPIAKLRAKWTWKDQGWGNKKGSIRVLLIRDGEVLATQAIGGIAGHEDSKHSDTFRKGHLIDNSACGDTLKFQYLIGGGGGHSLHIKNFKLSVYSISRAKSARK